MCERHGQTRAAGHDSRASGTEWTILREEEKERERELGCACGCWLRHCVCVCVSESLRETAALRRALNLSANHAVWNRPPTQPGSAGAAALWVPQRREKKMRRGGRWRKWEGEGGEEQKTSVLVTEITSCFPRSLSVLGIRLQWDARAHSQLHTWCIVRQPYLLLGKARFGLLSTLNHHYLGYAAIPDGKYIIEWSLFPLIRFDKCDIYTMNYLLNGIK